MSEHVAILVVGFRNADDITACLACLERSTWTDFSVHICENGGHEAYEALLDRLLADRRVDDLTRGADRATGRLAGGPQLSVHDAGANLGYAGAINLLFDRLRDAVDWSHVWILNPDTEPSDRALEALMTRAKEGGFGIVGSRLINASTGLVQLYGGRWRRLMARGYNIGLGRSVDAVPDTAAVEAEMDYVNGASMLVSRRFVETVGPMYDDYFLYGEEVDWCLRRGAWKLGYAHESLIHHHHGSTIGSNKDRRRRSALSVYLDERNKLLLTRRRFPALFPLVVLTTLALTAQYLRHGAVANFRVALRGWFAGVRGETGRPRWLA